MNNSGCIYKIENRKTGMMYIGSTRRFYARKKQHLNMLRQNKHFCSQLQDEWNRYGEQSFSFTRLSDRKPSTLVVGVRQSDYFVGERTDRTPEERRGTNDE